MVQGRAPTSTSGNHAGAHARVGLQPLYPAAVHGGWELCFQSPIRSAHTDHDPLGTSLSALLSPVSTSLALLLHGWFPAKPWCPKFRVPHPCGISFCVLRQARSQAETSASYAAGAFQLLGFTSCSLQFNRKKVRIDALYRNQSTCKSNYAVVTKWVDYQSCKSLMSRLRVCALLYSRFRISIGSNRLNIDVEELSHKGVLQL